MEYPTHEEIGDKVNVLVQGNMNFSCQHNRESLDDLISDLTQYRQSMANVDDYMKKNLL